MATKPTIYFLQEKALGNINVASDEFRLMLMATGFNFDQTVHRTYADVSASELAAGNGYITGGQILTGIITTDLEDLVNLWSQFSWPNHQWMPTGGPIGPSPGSIIYNNTHASKVVVGYLDGNGFSG